MKKTGLLVLLAASLACAQSTFTSTMTAAPDASGIVPTNRGVPFVRYQTPTTADIYCAGFVSKNRIADANFVTGGLETPTDTKFENGELVYLAGHGYQIGQLYTIVRELRDVNEYEAYPGMRKLLAPPDILTRKWAACALSICAVMKRLRKSSSVAIPSTPAMWRFRFAEREPVASAFPGISTASRRPTQSSPDAFSSPRTSTSCWAPVTTVYLNVSTDQGVKAGDYFE